MTPVEKIEMPNYRAVKRNIRIGVAVIVLLMMGYPV